MTKAASLPSGLARSTLLAFILQAAALVLNLFTGVLVARALGAAGRGELTAVMTPPQLTAWFFAMGVAQAAAYFVAKTPTDAGRFVGTWLVLLTPLAVTALLAGQLLLPLVLGAQQDELLVVARLFMLTVALAIFDELFTGLALAAQAFHFVNWRRVCQYAFIALGYALLLGLDAFTVSSALAVNAGVGVLSLGVTVAWTLRRYRIGRPSVALGRTTLWYGFRAHSTNLGQIVNARLDLLLIPAFLGAVSVGLYSVATNVAFIVVTVGGSLAQMALPAAVDRGDRAAATIVSLLHATLVVSAGLGLVIGLSAAPALAAIYGDEFSRAAGPLRILVPGCVCYAAATILWSGLYALDRPFTAALAQLAGLLITLVGLLLFLRTGGITAAALVSTTSYAAVFGVSAVLFCRASDTQVRALAPTVADLRTMGSRVFRRVRRSR